MMNQKWNQHHKLRNLQRYYHTILGSYKNSINDNSDGVAYVLINSYVAVEYDGTEASTMISNFESGIELTNDIIEEYEMILDCIILVIMVYWT